MEQELKLQEQSRPGGPRSHFSKQLIKEIVRAVERGASRRELIKRYGMAKSTLADWVREYGSPVYHASRKPLSAAERRSMVRAIEEGRMTVKEARLAYGLTSTSAVQRYLRQADKEKAELRRISLLMDSNEARSEPISSEDAESLKKALQEAELKIKALNTLIDAAEDQFKISIRKKPGARQSGD
jgi:transposase-like protein